MKGKRLFLVVSLIFLINTILFSELKKEEKKEYLLPKDEVIKYSMKIKIIPKMSFLQGEVNINFSPINKIILLLDKRSLISKISTGIRGTRITVLTDEETINNLNINYEEINKETLKNIKVYQVTLDEEKDKFSHLEIFYKILMKERAEDGNISFSHLKKEGEVKGVIDKRGIFLTFGNLWYPFVPGHLATYHLEVNVPKPYKVVSEGKMRKISDTFNNTFFFDVNYPAEGVDLAGSDYMISEEIHNGIKIGTYFFLRESKLSPLYLEKTKSYIDLYEKIFTKYPFSKFLTVENFLQTGYGMPSFTLLGNKVIRLPFIVDTSLGHEILHNWWGNSVYVDYSGGNWCEGLTVFYADYLYSDMKGKGRSYRFQILKDYYSYVTPENEISVKEFRSRTNPATRTIGYGKSMMFFYMLRNLVGKDIFEKGLRRFAILYKFKKASFDNIREIMEGVSDKNLTYFFEQWTDRKGAPKLKVEFVKQYKSGEFYILKIKVSQLQDGDPYIMEIPALIIAEDGSNIKHTISIYSKEQEIALQLTKKAVGFYLDPDYEIFRKLYEEEVPPSISLFLGKNSVEITGEKNRFDKEIADAFPNKKIDDTSNRIIIINPKKEIVLEKLKELGFSTKVKKVNIDGLEYNIKELSIILTTKEANGFYMLISTSNFSFPSSILPRIVHYGKYGLLIWDKNQNLIKKLELYPKTSPLNLHF